MTARDGESAHVTAIVVGEAGLLFRGPSGSGKSSLALAVLERAARAGRFAALVGDDRVRLKLRSGRLVAEGVENVRGLAEQRAVGLVGVPSLGACVVRLVVDLTSSSEPPTRFPEPEQSVAEFAGVQVPRIALSRSFGLDDAAAATLRALHLAVATSAATHDFP